MSDLPPQSACRARCEYQPGELAAVLEFLKRTRSELRMLRRVQVWDDRVLVFDVNSDYFEISGLGYEQAEIVPVLLAVHTNFNPATIHKPTAEGCKEFLTGRRHPWAEDRLM